jgi:branched-chain amino acid transport system substrate-binding protein
MFRRRFLSFAPQLAALAAAPAFIRTAHAQEGLSAKAVTIGSSGALSGPLAGFGADLKLGVEAAMGQINAKGGVNGRVLQFQMMDDAYVPQRTADNVKKMIGDGSIFALMSCIGTPNNTAIVPMIEESNLPYVAPLTGASSLRKPGMRNVFHVRASYTDETQRLVQKLVGMGIKDLAIVYLDNGFGKEVLADAVLALQAQGAKAVTQVALATDGKNLNEVVSQVSAAKPAPCCWARRAPPRWA